MFRTPNEKPATVTSCGFCGESYNTSVRAPLLLTCSHTCCEECVRNAIIGDGKVTCKECEQVSLPSPSNLKLQNIRETFRPCQHIMSELNKKEKLKPVDESCIGFKSKKQTPEKQQSPLVLLGSCGECNKVRGRYKCAECKATLCHACDLMIHSSRILQSHNRVVSSDAGSDHESQTSEKIAECKLQLKQYFGQLKKKRSKIENTIKKLNNEHILREAKSSYLNVPETEEALNQFFTYCHGVIQNLHTKLIKELHDKGLSLDRTRTVCLTELNATKQNVDKVLTEVFKVLELGVYECSVEELMKKCQTLMEANDEIRTTRPVVPSKKMEIPTHDWVPFLEDQLHLDFGQGGEFQLMCAPWDELEETEIDSLMAKARCGVDIGDSVEVMSCVSYEMSEQPKDYLNEYSQERRPSLTQSLNRLPVPPNNDFHSSGDHRRSPAHSVIESYRRTPDRSYRAMNGGVRQIKGPSFSTCGMTTTPYLYSTNYPKTLPNHYRDMKTATSKSMIRSRVSKQQIKFKEGCRQSVLISHVQSPSCFFVQLKESVHVLERYRKFFAKAPSLTPLKMEDVQLGNLYLAQCLDDEWYRVRIREFVPNSPTTEVSITQIDTGVTQAVELSRFRRLDDLTKAISMEPELAIQCSVHDCYPIASMWQPKDTALFIEVLRNKEITMVVKRVQANKLEVDLNWAENGGVTSIRDYMVMVKQACIAATRDQINNIPVAKETKYFMDKDFKANQWVNVRITSTMGPDEFYVRRNCPIDNKSFLNMADRIDAYYKVNQNYHSLQIHNPCIGSPVAAQYTLDNKWYRAEIISLKPQAKKAEVQYVDFGNTEILPFTKIRMLAEEFFRFTVQAVKCTLAEIAPVNNRYNMMAVKFFAKHVEEKDLQMVVQDIRPDEKGKRDVLHVLLYARTEDANLVAINALMVEEKHARAIGMDLGQSFYPKGKSASKLANKEAEPSTETGDSIVDENGSKELNDVESVDDSRPNRYHVTVANFASPNLFYVSLIEQLKNIRELTDEMAKFYREENTNKETAVESVEVGMKCALYVDEDKRWYRVVVKKLNDDGTVKVLLKDIGREEDVTVDMLRTLPKNFSRIIDGTIACRMVDVPVRNDWPTDLCDSLKEEFEKYASLYISHEGVSEDDTSVPVVLWGKRVICSGPFDPNTEEWTSINEVLLKTLALEEKESEATSEYEPPREDVLKKLETEGGEVNPEENVKEWLAKSVREATAKGVEYADIVENGVPPERLFSPYKSDVSVDGDALLNTTRDTALERAGSESADENWLQPEPLNVEEFLAVPTYVDTAFNIYVQSDEQKSMLVVISTGLQKKFGNSPVLPPDLIWSPGQLCIARFHLDNKWYRGKVIAVNGDKAEVEYVDYGNVETVQLNQLRKNIVLRNIPIQCHKIPIRSDLVPNKSPDGRWPTQTLDLVHHTIIEKKCRFKLRKENGEDFYRVEELVIPEKLDIFFGLLLSLDDVVLMPTKKNEISSKKIDLGGAPESVVNSVSSSKRGKTKDEAESDESSSIAAIESVSNLDFSELAQVPGVNASMDDPFSLPQNPQANEIIIKDYELPPTSDVCTVEVTEILELDELVVNVVDSNDESVKENRKSFLEMTGELQKKGYKQPILQPPYLGRVCCTKFHDNQWYRVKVTGPCMDDANVPILYIDYGNSATAEVNELHELKRAWFYVPVQALRCHLLDFGIEGRKGILTMVDKLLSNKYKAILQKLPDSEWYNVKLLEEIDS